MAFRVPLQKFAESNQLGCWYQAKDLKLNNI